MYKDSNDLTLDNSACCYSFSSLEAINSTRAKMLIQPEFALYSGSSPNGYYYGCRHYDFVQLRHLLGGCQILPSCQAPLLVSENNNIAIASATVCAQSEFFL